MWHLVKLHWNKTCVKKNQYHNIRNIHDKLVNWDVDYSCQTKLHISNYVGKIEFKKYGCSKVGNQTEIRKHQHECKSIIRISEIKQIYQYYENVVNSIQQNKNQIKHNTINETDNSDIEFLLNKCTTHL